MILSDDLLIVRPGQIWLILQLMSEVLWTELGVWYPLHGITSLVLCYRLQGMQSWIQLKQLLLMTMVPVRRFEVDNHLLPMLIPHFILNFRRGWWNWITTLCWCQSLLIPHFIFRFQRRIRWWITACCWCCSLLFPLFFLKGCMFIVTLDFLKWFFFVLCWWMVPLWMWSWRRMCLTRIAQNDGKVHTSHAVHWFNEEA